MTSINFPHNLSKGVVEHFGNAGGGVAGSHGVVNATATFTSTTEAYVYAIQVYSDTAKFTELEEGGASVAAERLDGGGVGYPKGAVITGRFNKVVPDADTTCGVFIVRNYDTSPASDSDE